MASPTWSTERLSVGRSAASVWMPQVSNTAVGTDGPRTSETTRSGVYFRGSGAVRTISPNSAAVPR